MSDTILDVRDLQVQFKTDTRTVKAVDGISFQVKRGQTLGIVGGIGFGEIGHIFSRHGVGAQSAGSGDGGRNLV